MDVWRMEEANAMRAVNDDRFTLNWIYHYGKGLSDELQQ